MVSSYTDLFPAVDAVMVSEHLLDLPIGKAVEKICDDRGWPRPPDDITPGSMFAELNAALDEERTPCWDEADG